MIRWIFSPAGWCPGGDGPMPGAGLGQPVTPLLRGPETLTRNIPANVGRARVPHQVTAGRVVYGTGSPAALRRAKMTGRAVPFGKNTRDLRLSELERRRDSVKGEDRSLRP